MKVFDLILFLKILYSTNRQSYDDSDADDYYDYDDHEDFGYCYDSDDGSTIYCFFKTNKRPTDWNMPQKYYYIKKLNWFDKRKIVAFLILYRTSKSTDFEKIVDVIVHLSKG